MRIKDISLDNRPRERMEKQGASTLSSAELLAVILQKGTHKNNVVDMSHKLISKYGLNNLSSCSLKELQEVEGVGKAKALQILALFEFNKRHNHSKISSKPIKSAKDVYEYCFLKLAGLDKEHFVALHLDTKNRVIKEEVISVGTLNSSLIHPREVFKSAIKESANSIILVHNHPSGVAKPSFEDKKITKILFESAKLLSIKVLDHVIIGREGYYSFDESS